MRRYERSKSSGTRTAALGEVIKTAALEGLVPSELEQHLAMNRARLITYEQVRSEIQAYIEVPPKSVRIAAKNTSDPMGVDSCGTGGKKGKKGKGDGRNGKKGGNGQNQSQNPNTNKELVCWR